MFSFFQSFCSFSRCHLIQTWIGQRTDLWFVDRSGKNQEYKSVSRYRTFIYLFILSHCLVFCLQLWSQNNTPPPPPKCYIGGTQCNTVLFNSNQNVLQNTENGSKICSSVVGVTHAIDFLFSSILGHGLVSLGKNEGKNIPLAQMISHKSIQGLRRQLRLKPYFFRKTDNGVTCQVNYCLHSAFQQIQLSRTKRHINILISLMVNN